MNEKIPCPRCGVPRDSMMHEESADWLYCFECFQIVDDARQKVYEEQIARQNPVVKGE
jgi:late competence protein required for DNA uptake (superfamily II DNA/RNA helicase)